MEEPIPFMYIIRSENRASGTVANSYFRLNGLPQNYKKFKAEVISFYQNHNGQAGTLVELKTDLPLQNGYETTNHRLITLATNSTIWASTFEFLVENFNGRTVNFLVSDNDANNNDITAWVLYLKLTGLKE